MPSINELIDLRDHLALRRVQAEDKYEHAYQTHNEAGQERWTIESRDLADRISHVDKLIDQAIGYEDHHDDFIKWHKDGETLDDLSVHHPRDLRIEDLGSNGYFLAFIDHAGDHHHFHADGLRWAWTDEEAA